MTPVRFDAWDRATASGHSRVRWITRSTRATTAVQTGLIGDETRDGGGGMQV